MHPFFSSVHPIIFHTHFLGSGSPEEDEQISSFLFTEGGKTTIAYNVHQSIQSVRRAILFLLYVLQNDNKDSDCTDEDDEGSVTTNRSNSSGMASVCPYACNLLF